MAGDRVIYKDTNKKCYIARTIRSAWDDFKYNLEDENGKVVAKEVRESRLRLVD